LGSTLFCLLPTVFRSHRLSSLGSCAYHAHIQLGCIAQGLLQYLAIHFSATVWHSFGSWLRTMKIDLPPSELVVAHALRATLTDFLRIGPDPPMPNYENSSPASSAPPRPCAISARRHRLTPLQPQNSALSR
jgi:hypothetical protein